MALPPFHPTVDTAIAPQESERIQAFRARCDYVRQQAVRHPPIEGPDWSALFAVAACFYAGEKLDWARERLRTANDPPEGAMFWMHPMVLIMHAGRENLTADDWTFIRGLWKCYFPTRGDTENHWLMYYASLYLACEMFPDAGPEAWYNGKSSAENLTDATDYIRNWIRITTSYGQGEYDSPNYIEEYVRPLALLSGWAADPGMRQQATMMLDYVVLDFVSDSLKGLYGGAHSRLYPRHALQPATTAAAALGWLLFGQGEYDWATFEQNQYQSNAGNLIVALSGYTPPAILHRIAHDRSEPFVNRELKRTRWRLRDAGPEAFEVDGRWTTPVYKYTYVHPDFVLGSSQGGLLQPIQQQTWSLIWDDSPVLGKTNTMFNVQPYAEPDEGGMYFVSDRDMVMDLISRSKVDYESPDKLEGGSPYEQIFQHTSTLIGLYKIPAEARYRHIHTLFSRDRVERKEDETGWICARAGRIYLAYRPLVSGEWKPVDWTGLLKGGAGDWFSEDFDTLSAGSECYVSEALQNGFVLHVGAASDYASYADFCSTVRGLSLDIALAPLPRVRFKTPAGTVLEAAYNSTLRIDGEAVDRASWSLFDSPFATAERESEGLEMRHEAERYVMDFKHPKLSRSIEALDPTRNK